MPPSARWISTLDQPCFKPPCSCPSWQRRHCAGRHTASRTVLRCSAPLTSIRHVKHRPRLHRPYERLEQMRSSSLYFPPGLCNRAHDWAALRADWRQRQRQDQLPAVPRQQGGAGHQLDVAPALAGLPARSTRLRVVPCCGIAWACVSHQLEPPLPCVIVSISQREQHMPGGLCCPRNLVHHARMAAWCRCPAQCLTAVASWLAVPRLSCAACRIMGRYRVWLSPGCGRCPGQVPIPDHMDLYHLHQEAEPSGQDRAAERGGPHRGGGRAPERARGAHHVRVRAGGRAAAGARGPFLFWRRAVFLVSPGRGGG